MIGDDIVNNKKGFSLIELITVIIIIGLILIIALPAVTRLLKSNNNKQYEQYFEVVKAGALRYSLELRDELGGYNDNGCIDNITLEDLIKENMVKEFNDKNITCTGKVRLDNVKGSISASINLTCKNNRGVVTYEVNEIKEGTCDEHVPENDPQEPSENDPNGPDNENNTGSCSTISNGITLANKILGDNIEQSDSGINFSAISSDTNGKGLYYTSTNTEGNQRTYYFRGTVTNNFVRFAGFYWRIVRINEDGSIRLIYNGTSSSATGSATTTGKSAFNSKNSDNAHVGYMYGTTGSSTHAATHANNNPSVIKTYLDNWYVNNLNSYSSYLADAGFCNDRSIAPSAGLWYSTDTALGYGENYTYYGAFNRLKNGKPQFKCPNTSNDLFTMTNSSKGNKKLTYPIGLITADEVTYAGGLANITKTNKTMYLYTGVSYWTMSPNVFEITTSDYGRFTWPHVHSVTSDGYIGGGYVSYTEQYMVRPVINLKSCVLWNSGDGTSDLPYQINDCKC